MKEMGSVYSQNIKYYVYLCSKFDVFEFLNTRIFKFLVVSNRSDTILYHNGLQPRKLGQTNFSFSWFPFLPSIGITKLQILVKYTDLNSWVLLEIFYISWPHLMILKVVAKARRALEWSTYWAIRWLEICHLGPKLHHRQIFWTMTAYNLKKFTSRSIY